MNENTEKIEKLYCLARDRFHEHDLPHAIDSLKALLALDFKHLDAHFLLALIYAQDQSYELSSQHLRACMADDYKKNELYKLIAFNSRQLALYKNALHELQKHLHYNPEDDDAYAQMGDIYLLQKEYQYAKKVYLQAIKMDPKKALYYFRIAHVYEGEDNLKQAILEAQKALALDASYHEVMFYMATLYAKMGDFKKAIDHYEKAININEDIALYHHNLAIALENICEGGKALESHNRALLLEPKNAHYQKSLNITQT